MDLILEVENDISRANNRKKNDTNKINFDKRNKAYRMGNFEHIVLTENRYYLIDCPSLTSPPHQQQINNRKIQPVGDISVVIILT